MTANGDAESRGIPCQRRGGVGNRRGFAGEMENCRPTATSQHAGLCLGRNPQMETKAAEPLVSKRLGVM